MKTNRKVVRSVICVLLALIFVVSLMTALIPVNASAASQSEINQLTQQRKELQAKQKEQQKTISNLRAKKASIVEQKAALDQEMNLAQQEIDLIVLAGFLTILSADFTARWPSRILNVHPSLIPAFCGKGMYGLKVHEAALRTGVKVTGATVHFVNEIPDGGRILLQKAVEVLPDDTPETLQRRVMEQAEWQLLPRAAELVSEQIVKEKRNA